MQHSNISRLDWIYRFLFCPFVCRSWSAQELLPTVNICSKRRDHVIGSGMHLNDAKKSGVLQRRPKVIRGVAPVKILTPWLHRVCNQPLHDACTSWPLNDS